MLFFSRNIGWFISVCRFGIVNCVSKVLLYVIMKCVVEGKWCVVVVIFECSMNYVFGICLVI